MIDAEPSGDGKGDGKIVDCDFMSRELQRRNLKLVRFQELCRCGDEIWIENDGEIYRLRRTRQGKLILTK